MIDKLRKEKRRRKMSEKWVYTFNEL